VEIFKLSQFLSQRTVFLRNSQQASCFHQHIGRLRTLQPVRMQVFATIDAARHARSAHR